MDYEYDPPVPNGRGHAGLETLISPFIQLLGLTSIFGSFLGGGGGGLGGIGLNGNSGAKWLFLGSLAAVGRQLFIWVSQRYRFEYTVSGQFDQGDPAYEWILLFITKEKLWKRSRNFRVSAASSKRKWSVQTTPDATRKGNADYVPLYDAPLLFRWNGYWVEVTKNRGVYHEATHMSAPATLNVKIYSWDMSVLSKFVEEARQGYQAVGQPDVTVHMADQPHYGFGMANPWTEVKRKSRRPLSSIVLQDQVITELVEDVKEFLEADEWYSAAGIPHHRGYLLYGPPGTGKTSTIYALAGELGLEIYSLSLSSSFVDDSFLQRAVAHIPKHSILLIEDIDCAFTGSREDEDEEALRPNLFPGAFPAPRGRFGPAVSMSGLLNVLDGVGSEEGKLFFATTNHVDKLDSAIMRPGRIDKTIPYFLASRGQAAALFMKFFPESRFPDIRALEDLTPTPTSTLGLSQVFASRLPENEFSTAQIQGYLLGYKKDPVLAVMEVEKWVENERAIKAAKRRKSEGRRASAHSRDIPPPVQTLPTAASVIPTVEVVHNVTPPAPSSHLLLIHFNPVTASSPQLQSCQVVAPTLPNPAVKAPDGVSPPTPKSPSTIMPPEAPPPPPPLPVAPVICPLFTQVDGIYVPLLFNPGTTEHPSGYVVHVLQPTTCSGIDAGHCPQYPGTHFPYAPSPPDLGNLPVDREVARSSVQAPVSVLKDHGHSSRSPSPSHPLGLVALLEEASTGNDLQVRSAHQTSPLSALSATRSS